MKLEKKKIQKEKEILTPEDEAAIEYEKSRFLEEVLMLRTTSVDLS